MKNKLYRMTYKFVCSDCGEFSHTLNKYCEICGALDTVHVAKKKDYKE